MSFGNLGKKDTIKKDVDVVRTGNSALESDVHDFVIEVAYFGKSKGGAASLNLQLKHKGGIFKPTLWITGGDAKGNNNFYTDNDGEEHYLPGFVVADAIAMLTCGGESLAELAEGTTAKVIKLYDFDAKADVNTEVESIEEMEGQEISLGVVKRIVDKTKNTAPKGEKAVYVATGETREENEVTKVFNPDDGRTVPEMLAEQDEAIFITEWKEAYAGKTQNKAKGAPEGGATKGTPPAKDTTKKKAIFGKK